MKKTRGNGPSLLFIELLGRHPITFAIRNMIAFLTLVLTLFSTFCFAADGDLGPGWTVPDASTPLPTVGQVFTTDGIIHKKLTSPLKTDGYIGWSSCFATPKIMNFDGIVYIYASAFPTAGPAADGCEWNNYSRVYAERHYTYSAYTVVTTDPVSWPPQIYPISTPNPDTGKSECNDILMD